MSETNVVHINNRHELGNAVEEKTPLAALCGFVRVPKVHNADEPFEVCARCTQIAVAMQSTGQAKGGRISLLTDKPTPTSDTYVTSTTTSYTFTIKGI